MTLAISEHLPLIASAPEGIQKLRNLILELAVRGKLVPQDSKDEPSDELLIKLTKERARLVEEGGIKKSKAVPQVAADEQPFSLPKGWQWVRLATIGNIFNGNSINSSEKDGRFRRDDGIPYIATKDVGYGLTPLDYDNGVRIPESETNFRMARAGAVFICAEGGSAGKKCGLCDRDVFFGNKLFANETFSEIPPRFILYTYLSPFFREQFSAAMTGIIGGVSFAKFVELPIPMPPIKEQNRIVAKVDELMALCDRLETNQNESSAAHTQLVETLLGTLTQSTDSADFEANWQRISEHFDTLFTTEASIEALEKTILQLGIMGKLVPQDPNDELASDLLKRIQLKRSHLESEGKIKKSKQLPAVDDAERTFIAPKGWVWCRLQQAFDVRDGTHDSPKFLSTGIPFLTSKNIYGGKLDLTDLKFISESDHIEFSKRSKVDQDDILFAMIGSIGNPVVVNTDMNFSFKNMALFKYFSRELSNPQFLHAFLSVVATDMKAKAAGGVQSFVPLGTIRNQPIALPPLAEQNRIVAKVDELMALCSQLRAHLAEGEIQESRLADTLIQNALSITA